jgi:3-ketosteroid 9alpha-monooxygenase subunit A
MTYNVDDDVAVREIDTGTPPDRYARGWHCVGLAEEFDDGAPHAIEVFGTKLVVWSIDGEFAALDNYCRHMGGDLSIGTMKDGRIACPFHDWRWAADGRCTHVPYAKRPPRLARTRTWPTMVRNNQLFIYNDFEGNPPPSVCVVPALEQCETGEWSPWTWNRLVINGAHSREIMDNVSDMAHFFYVHYAMPEYFMNVFEGETATQYLASQGRPDVDLTTSYGKTRLESTATYYGPAYMLQYMHQTYGEYSIDSILVNCHYPIDMNSFVLMFGVMVRRPVGFTDEQVNAMLEKIAAGIEVGYLQDVNIWQSKTRIDNPLLVEEDGAVYQLRRWYDQFYVDVADVTPEMTARFECEVDTTNAQESWANEVQDNLRRRETGAALQTEVDKKQARVKALRKQAEL